MPLRVFLSYRRDDDASRATLLRYIVEAAFNRPGQPARVEVFQDTQQRAGVRWPDEVRERLCAADIVVAVIGPQWLGARDQHMRRRIDQPDDWIRLELDYALHQGTTVLPVIFAVEPPSAEALPDKLRDLSSLQMVRVRDDHAEHDLQPLLAEIERWLGEQPPRSSTAAAPQALAYPDPPLPIKPTALDEAELQETLNDVLPAWVIKVSSRPEDATQTRHELFRELRFASFTDAVEFMGAMVSVIENVNHHPRWENLYRTLWVYLSTWDIGSRISYADVMLAQAFDRSFAAYEERGG